MNTSLNRLLVPEGATIIEAMRVMNAGSRAIAFVHDPRDRIVGLLTDGDIRRGLLAGRALDEACLTDIARRDFRFVGPEAGRAEALDLMKALGIDHIPVLDSERRLVGLHLIQEMIGAKERNNWAVIMAGGRGIRLRPITEQVPKPMITVAGRPMLERLVLHLVGYGIRRIFLAVNYLAHIIEDHFQDGARFGCHIEYLREPVPLGTGGALTFLPPAADSVLVMNGDLVTQFNVDRILDFHAQGGYAATFGIRPHHIEIPFGVVDVRGNQLIGVREKPTENVLVNAGIYVLSPLALAVIPKNEEFPITRIAEECAKRNLPMGAHLIEDEWMDVGQPKDLRAVRGQA